MKDSAAWVSRRFKYCKAGDAALVQKRNRHPQTKVHRVPVIFKTFPSAIQETRHPPCLPGDQVPD
jgi:hypothetical protein